MVLLQLDLRTEHLDDCHEEAMRRYSRRTILVTVLAVALASAVVPVGATTTADTEVYGSKALDYSEFTVGPKLSSAAYLACE